MCEEKGNTEEKPIIAVTENTELAEQTETTAESVQPMRKCLNCGTLSNVGIVYDRTEYDGRIGKRVLT